MGTSRGVSVSLGDAAADGARCAGRGMTIVASSGGLFGDASGGTTGTTGATGATGADCAGALIAGAGVWSWARRAALGIVGGAACASGMLAA